jgi:hypothetical protein
MHFPTLLLLAASLRGSFFHRPAKDAPAPGRQRFRFSMPAGTETCLVVDGGEPLFAASSIPSPAGVAASLALRSADRAVTAAGYRHPRTRFPGRIHKLYRESQRRALLGLPALVNVSFAEIGRWRVAMFDHTEASRTVTHLRAHWFTAEEWFNLHFSAVGEEGTRPPLHRLTALLAASAIEDEPGQPSSPAGPDGGIRRDLSRKFTSG